MFFTNNCNNISVYFEITAIFNFISIWSLKVIVITLHSVLIGMEIFKWKVNGRDTVCSSVVWYRYHSMHKLHIYKRQIMYQIYFYSYLYFHVQTLRFFDTCRQSLWTAKFGKRRLCMVMDRKIHRSINT